MAGNSLSLVWDLIARDGASPVFERVGAAAETAGAKTEAASAKIGGGLSTAAKVAGVAGAAFAVVSVKMAADYQSSTTRLVTSANESVKNLKMVQQGMLDMAGQTGYSAEALSAAMYKVESGGQHGAAGLAVLKAAAQGARTENADLATVADAVTSAMQDYHLKASDAADVTSKLVAATASGKMTFEELAGSLSAVLPIASANHVALNDILGDLASMTIHGMSAEQASQNLADAIRHLAAPTQQQSKELAALGISSTELSSSLGQKGVSGAIQEVSQAIQSKLGPGGTQIILDLNTALAKLPKSVQDFAKGMLDGTKSVSDYRKEIKSLPPETAATLQSFNTLIGSTHQLGAETKSGSEVYQSYSGALRLALGDATSMNVALMLTGENSKTTATAISNVSKATADAKGNVKGWNEIQKTFNQQLAEFGQKAESATIEVGQHLLPALTGTLGYINRDGVPAVRGLVSGFTSLPAPIRDVGLTLAGLGIANAIGLTGTLTAGMTRLGASFTGTGGMVRALGDDMAVQQRLSQMDAASISEVDRALGGLNAGLAANTAELSAVQRMMLGYDAALAESVVADNAAAAGAGRFSTALSTVAIRGGEAAASGIGSFVNALGGPWGIAIGAAILSLPTLANGFEILTGHVIDSTAAAQSFTSALQASNGVIDESVRKNIQQQITQSGVISTFQKAGISAQDAIAGIEGNRQAQDHVTQALQNYITTSIATEGRNNKNAQSAAQARDAYNQLMDAFGGSRKAADYFGGSIDAVSAKAFNATVSVRNLQAQIDNLHGRQITIEVLSKGSAGPSAYAVPGSGIGGYAAGGWTGPGGKYTPAGIVHADEFVFTKEQTNAAGVARLAALASALDRGYAGGGLVTNPTGGTAGYDPNAIKVMWDTTAADAAIASAKKSALTAAAAFAPGAPGNVAANAALARTMVSTLGWTGAQWNALYALGQRESGWNNNAQNPHSTAYGIPQFLDGTWATVGMKKTSDPGSQIIGMERYIQQRYRDPIGAWAHETKFGWYKNGTNYVPSDGLAMLHKGEAVVPADKNQGAPYRSGPTSITLQLDGPATTDLLEGRAVKVVTDYNTTVLDRAAY